MKPEVLLVTRSAEAAATAARELEADDYGTVTATTAIEAIGCLKRQPFSVVVVDLGMPGVDTGDVESLMLLHESRSLRPAAQVVVVTAPDTPRTAGAGLHAAACDWLTKPLSTADLRTAVRRAAECHRLGEENCRLRQLIERQRPSEELLGVSPPLHRLKQQISAVAHSDSAVLLVGEIASGFELVARAVHRQSARYYGPFVAVNCATIPTTLLESELFGHERGGLTGARRTHHGFFAEAHGGTILLDEIAEMPVSFQPKLQRVLRDRSVRPVGSQDDLRVDVRVVATTRRDMARLVRSKWFRDDRYDSPPVVALEVPSLRDRPEDIPMLARHFVDQSARRLGRSFDGMTDDAIAWLQRQRWPGNLRELENVIERAVTLARNRVIDVDAFGVPSSAIATGEVGVKPTLAELEHDYLQRVLRETRGDKRAAARILGISVRTIQRKTPPPRRESLDGW